MKIIKNFWDKIISYFKTKEVHPLSAANAQSLAFYGEAYDYEDMINRFRKEMFKNIKSDTYFGRNYTVERIPCWLSDKRKQEIIDELTKLGYNVIEVKEVKLLIIHWDICL